MGVFDCGDTGAGLAAVWMRSDNGGMESGGTVMGLVEEGGWGCPEVRGEDLGFSMA